MSLQKGMPDSVFRESTDVGTNGRLAKLLFAAARRDELNLQPTVLLAEDLDDDVTLLRRASRKAEIPNVQAVKDGEQALDYLKGVGPYSDREAHPFPTVLLVDYSFSK